MKKLISTILAGTMLLSAMTAIAADKDYPQKFWDVPKTHWAFENIAELVDRGVINGYEDGSFKPDGTVTRAEWAKIMVGAAGLQANDKSVRFSDMKGHWAIPYVNAAKDYLTAYSDNTFRPNQAAVREDVTVAMVKLKGYDVSDVDYSYLNKFTDTDSISNNMKAYVAVAVEKGLISGFEDNTFRGQATLTRAEAATLLWRAFQYGSDNKVVDTATSAPTDTPVVSTVKPTATPKVTKKPMPNPTEKVTEEPTVEPTPVPTPTKEPKDVWISDTIFKGVSAGQYNDGSDAHIVYDNKRDILYCVKDNKILSYDIYGEDTSEIDISSIIYKKDTNELLSEASEGDDGYYKDFEISRIYYDNVRDRLYVFAYPTKIADVYGLSDHDANMGELCFYYDSDKSMHFVKLSTYSTTLVGSYDKGLLAVDTSGGNVREYSCDPDTFERLSGIVDIPADWRSYRDAITTRTSYIEDDGCLYYYGYLELPYRASLFKYDFQDWTCVRSMSLNDQYNAATNEVTKTYYVYENNYIAKMSLDGSLSKMLEFDNIKIKVKDMDEPNLKDAIKFFVASDEKTIIFREPDGDVKILQKQ